MLTKAKKTTQEYIKRLNYALDFIEKNLDADLSLEKISHKAHYSPYHFHRIFSTIIGENLNQYVTRKRIERIASILLLGTKDSIKNLSYKYGFNSESSFSRAFKKYYGIAPSKFKSEGQNKLSKIGIEPFKSEKYICDINNIKKWVEMNAQITLRTIKDIKLASIMHIAEFDKIGSMYQKLIEWGHKNDVLPTSGFQAMTIYHDNPNVTQISRVRYSACVTVDKNIKAEGEIRPYILKGGNYAVGHFEINSKDFPKAWKSMLIWVIENSYQFRDADYFEEYLNDYKTHPEQKHIINIYIPVVQVSTKKNKAKISNCESTTEQNQTVFDYFQLINFMKDIKSFFDKKYGLDFKFGSIYKGGKDFSYFSLTTEALKRQKLKFVLIFNHKILNFRICLSGQNKSIRKKYWNLFKGSDWNTYHLAESIDDSLSIIDFLIVEKPNFNNMETLINQIETESFKFINEFRSILEQ